MIIYVNFDKNTGQITINNDMYPDTDIVQLNPSSLENTENTMRFEIAFNTSSFEKLHNTMENNNGNNN